MILAYSIKVGHFISNLFKSELIGTVRRNITTWTDFYLPRGFLVVVYAFFQKGITFTSEVRFQCYFFLNDLFF
jgi:hypothetical protein